MTSEVLRSYLQKHRYRLQNLQLERSYDPGVVVVIPALAEENILTTLISLSACIRPRSLVEIIVVINHSSAAEASIKHLNLQCRDTILSNKDYLEHEWLKISIIQAFDLPRKHAGVGLARKIGMDEAIARFLENGRANGLILSLDADCTCDRTYLIAVEDYFRSNNEAWAAGIYFEHDIEDPDISSRQQNAIIQYELHLRYLVMALRYSGFPHSYHTIGSCMAVRAEAYAKLGGMNKRKAGEDFHFLQKFIEVGRFGQIDSTRVLPSSRPSWRVPFGTGKSIQAHEEVDKLYTYSFSSFKDLKILVDSISHLYDQQDADLWYRSLPDDVQKFLGRFDWRKSVAQIFKHTGSNAAFTKRFWRWINALRVIQFLHSSRAFYPDVPVREASTQLAGILGIMVQNPSENKELLHLYRRYERESYA